MQCRLGIANIKKLNIRQNKTQTYVNLGTIRQSRWLTKRYMVNINFTVFINILGSSQRKVVPLLASPCPCVRRSSWKWLKDFHEISWCVFLINKYAKFLRLHIWINYTQFVYYATRLAHWPSSDCMYYHLTLQLLCWPMFIGFSLDSCLQTRSTAYCSCINDTSLM